MQFVSERVSIDRSAGRLSIVISPRLTRGKEAMLLTWVLAWLACGAYVIYEAWHMSPGRERQFVLAFLAFWLYFLIRIGRVALWRLRGFELLRVKDGVLTIKNSILGFGRARDHFAENITGLSLLEIDPRSWKWQFNESFWVMGGERLCFTHVGRQVAFGRGLNNAEAQQLLALVKAALSRERKNAQ